MTLTGKRQGNAMNIPVSTCADDCERALDALIADGPTSLDDLRIKLGWSWHHTNRVLTDLRMNGSVEPVTERVRGKNVAKYGIKDKRS